MNPTTLKNTADDAAVATTASRNLAALIERERGKGAEADRTWMRAAEASMAGWDGQARNANAALMRQIADAPAAPGHGAAFTSSPAFRRRTGLTTDAVALPGFLEERQAHPRGDAAADHGPPEPGRRRGRLEVHAVSGWAAIGELPPVR